MKSFLIAVNSGFSANNPRVVEVEDDLQEFYALIGCEWIDIVSRRIAGKWFVIVCDDEGLLKDSPKVSAINSERRPMLVGNLLFFHEDDEGNLVGISDDDVAFLKRNLTFDRIDGHPVITGCEYR